MTPSRSCTGWVASPIGALAVLGTIFGSSIWETPFRKFDVPRERDTCVVRTFALAAALDSTLSLSDRRSAAIILSINSRRSRPVSFSPSLWHANFSSSRRRWARRSLNEMLCERLMRSRSSFRGVFEKNPIPTFRAIS